MTESEEMAAGLTTTPEAYEKPKAGTVRHVISDTETAEDMGRGVVRIRDHVRFSVFENGSHAVLTLRRGNSLEWATGHPTEEGYSAEGCLWYWPSGDSFIYRDSWTDGRDCDGRLSTDTSCRVHVNDLRARAYATCPKCGQHIERDTRRGICFYCGRLPVGVEWTRVPRWERLDSSQRDYAAEAAGY
jgi:predicted RNA-binding Zn-ribbon protein involved in translation (DUF1610 family)